MYFHTPVFVVDFNILLKKNAREYCDSPASDLMVFGDAASRNQLNYGLPHHHINMGLTSATGSD